MKKIILLLAFISMITLQSCTVHEEVVTPVQTTDNDTISEVLEYTVSFNSGNNYKRLITFNRPIYTSDMVLVYRLDNNLVNNGTDVWRQMPQTYYLGTTGELDYNFDFTNYDVNIFLGANFDLNTLSSDWTQNQTFRIVIVPAYFGNKMAIDYSNYDAVVKAYNLDDSKIIKNRN
ncbi:hypothetical protein SAMN05660845_0612 [Flavobacterium swingsii]|uniref:Lipoprotein n=1 Tax=Flavobacterium swingsii TaxID=498292 RepID=A0A1I0W8F1_9FLAO|nr:hypothetical protein [Flavobacterium swingsii]SFA84834.1 hypothetical protein SAMN05660845_0612 [Flavobacterium swingsii]